MKKAPILSPLMGHNVVAEYNGARESVVKVSRGQSLHKAAIEAALERALQELGSSEDLVRNTCFSLRSSVGLTNSDCFNVHDRWAEVTLYTSW